MNKIYTTHGIKTTDDYTGTVKVNGKEYKYFPEIKEKCMYARDEETWEIRIIKKNGYTCSIPTIKKSIREVFND